MSEAIVVAIITGGISLIGSIISAQRSTREMQNRVDTRLAVVESKITELTREVREHNGFARRMPVVEEQIKVANHRISDLENKEEKHEHQAHYMD